MRRWHTIAIVFAVMLAAALPANAQDSKPELAKVRLAVGGKPALFYLPLTVTERLGYFREQGLEVEISDFPGGARALQALLGGSADVVTGSFDHTIQMQGKGQSIVATIQLGQFPGYVLAVLQAKAQRYQGTKDLKGMKIGITAPGSGTHLMVQHFMVKNGLRKDDASFIGVGASASAVAAVQRGEIDALVNVDPVISLLESQGLIKIIADTRTAQGSREVFGGPYPAAVLYAQRAFIEKNPRTMQALVNALLGGLKWMATHSPQEIAALMPEEYALGNKALYVQAITKSLPMYSRDGRFSREGADTAYAVLKAFDPEVANAKIDVAATYTDAFIDKAQSK
jgi:NitT/TauT family transport system substrate-binding protein